MKKELDYVSIRIIECLKLNKKFGVSLQELCEFADVTPNNIYRYFKNITREGIQLTKFTKHGKAYYKLLEISKNNVSTGDFYINKYELTSDKNFMIDNPSDEIKITRHYIHATEQGRKIKNHRLIINGEENIPKYDTNTDNFKSYIIQLPPNSTLSVIDRYTVTSESLIIDWDSEPIRDFDMYTRNFHFGKKLKNPPQVTTTVNEIESKLENLRETGKNIYIFKKHDVKAYSHFKFNWIWYEKEDQKPTSSSKHKVL